MSFNSKAENPQVSITQRVNEQIQALEKMAYDHNFGTDEELFALTLFHQQLAVRIESMRKVSPKFLDDKTRDAMKSELHEYHSSYFQSDYDIDLCIKVGVSLVGLDNMSDSELLADLSHNEQDAVTNPSSLLQQALAELNVHMMLQTNNG